MGRGVVDDHRLLTVRMCVVDLDGRLGVSDCVTVGGQRELGHRMGCSTVVSKHISHA